MKSVRLGVSLTLVAVPLIPSGAQAQTTDVDVHVGGLLRTGLRAEPSEIGRDQFEIFDARVGVSGHIGLIFDYDAVTEWDDEQDRVRLLDATLSLPVRHDLLRLTFGQFKAPFGREELDGKGEIPLVERSQATLAIAPGRQVGLQASGRALEGRLAYWAGAFNGNGRTFENDNDAFLTAARVQVRTVGDVEFFEDVVIQVGANVAFSSDSALPLLPVSARGVPGGVERPIRDTFTGDRFLWGGDLRFSYLGYFFNAEYLRGEYEFDMPFFRITGGGTSVSVAPGEELDAEGFILEGGYRVWGALDAFLRYDDFDPAIAEAGVPNRSKFVVLGLNLHPGFYAKVGLQYAIGVDGTRRGVGLADEQFLLNLQLDF
ncbi:MAG: porin [Gemmatimonadota bacterium]